MDTSSPLLAQFLAAHQRAEALLADVREAEVRARQLRLEFNLAKAELENAKRMVENRS